MQFGNSSIGTSFLFIAQAAKRLGGQLSGTEQKQEFTDSYIQGSSSKTNSKLSNFRNQYASGFDGLRDRVRLGEEGQQRIEITRNLSDLITDMRLTDASEISQEEIDNFQGRISNLTDTLGTLEHGTAARDLMVGLLGEANTDLEELSAMATARDEALNAIPSVEEVAQTIDDLQQADAQIEDALAALPDLIEVPPQEGGQQEAGEAAAPAPSLLEGLSNATAEDVAASMEANGAAHMTFDGNFTSRNGAEVIEHTDALAVEQGTIEMRVELNDTDRYQVLMSKNVDGEAAQGDFTVYVDDGNLYAFLQNDGQETRLNAGSISEDEMHTLSFTFGDGEFSIFVDGEERVSAAHEGGLNGNDEDLLIGGYERNGHTIFQAAGTISDVVVHDSILSNEQIANRADGNLEIMGIAAPPAQSAPPPEPTAPTNTIDSGDSDGVNEALATDGVVHIEHSGGVEVIEHSEALEIEQGTIEMNINLDSTWGLQSLLSKNVDGEIADGDLTVYVENGNLYAFLQNDGEETRLNAGRVNANEDHSIALTFGDGQLEIWVDGEKRVEGAAPGGLTGNSQDLYIGGYERNGGSTFEVRGEISDIVIRNEILSDQELEERGGSGDLSIPGPETTDPTPEVGNDAVPDQSRLEIVKNSLEGISADLDRATTATDVEQLAAVNHARLENLLRYIDQVPTSADDYEDVQSIRGQVDAARQKLEKYAGTEANTPEPMYDKLAEAEQNLMGALRIATGRGERKWKADKENHYIGIGGGAQRYQSAIKGITAQEAGLQVLSRHSGGSNIQMQASGGKVHRVAVTGSSKAFVNELKEFGRFKSRLDKAKDRQRTAAAAQKGQERQKRQMAVKMMEMARNVLDGQASSSPHLASERVAALEAVMLEKAVTEASMDQTPISTTPGRIISTGLDTMG